MIAPSVGAGYQLGRIDFQQNGRVNRFDNNGILLQGAISINPSLNFSIQGRYNKLIEFDTFDLEIFELGLKFRIKG